MLRGPAGFNESSLDHEDERIARKEYFTSNTLNDGIVLVDAWIHSIVMLSTLDARAAYFQGTKLTSGLIERETVSSGSNRD